MKKTLMTFLGANLGAAVMVAGLLAATAPEAESRSGTGNDRTGMTVSNQGMMVSTSIVSSSMPNDDILPSAENTVPGNSGMQGTPGGKGLGRHDVQRGM